MEQPSRNGGSAETGSGRPRNVRMPASRARWLLVPLLALVSAGCVTVRPEQVVEVAFDGVQRSSRYSGGLALRFARVLRYRDDKTADEADTLATVRSLWPVDDSDGADAVGGQQHDEDPANDDPVDDERGE